MRSSEERNIVFDLVSCEAGCVLKAAESADTREDRVRLEWSVTFITIDSQDRCKYLGTTIAWQCVVPETLVRAFDWSLIIVMTVGVGRAYNRSGEGKILHDCDENNGKIVNSCWRRIRGVRFYKSSSSECCLTAFRETLPNMTASTD